MPKRNIKRITKRHLAKVKRAKLTDWQTLRAQIEIYAGACVDRSWAGGGDPADRDTLELNAQLQRAVLLGHIEEDGARVFR